MALAANILSESGQAFSDDEDYKNPPDATPRREGGDDALAETSPLDSRSDEKVIFNEPQKSSQTDQQGAIANKPAEKEEKDII